MLTAPFPLHRRSDPRCPQPYPNSKAKRKRDMQINEEKLNAFLGKMVNDLGWRL